MIEYITDYEHLALYYEKISGEKIGQCEYCGRLFRQGKTKTANYCHKHRGYKKANVQILTCVDCGKEFEAGSKSRKKCRCIECQRKKHLEDMRNWRSRQK